MRGSFIIEKVLELLQAQAEATVDLLDVFTSSYGDSRRKMWRSHRYGPKQFKTDWAAAFRDWRHFRRLLHYLKSEGLIENKKRGGRTLWSITKRGLEKLKILKNRNLYSKESAAYRKAQPEASVKIIAYDIPASEGHKKRDWIRFALQNMGFIILQKSVWVGKKKIPEEFLRDLKERGMLGYIHILEVAKRGTIRELA